MQTLSALLLVTCFTFPDTETRTREGVVLVEGHYRHYGEIREKRTTLSFTEYGAAREVEWRVWWSDDADPEVKRYRQGGKGLWVEEEGTRRRLQVPEEMDWARQLIVVAGSPKDREWPVAHPRLGDVKDWVKFNPDGGMRAKVHEHGVVYEFVLGPPDTRKLTAEECVAGNRARWPSKPEVDLPSREPLVEPLAEDVWGVVLRDHDARCLVVKLGDALAVLEAPADSEAGERIVDVVRARWPEHPIRWVLFSHYHPHYTGGLRAFMAAGASVITTAGNERYVRDVAAREFSWKPDRWQQQSDPLRIQVFVDRLTLSDADRSLVAIDIGERSRHTDEYVVFWLPEQGLLFQGDLGWYDDGSGGVRAGRRTIALTETMEAEDIEPVQVVQAWPAVGVPATLTPVQIRALLD